MANEHGKMAKAKKRRPRKIDDFVLSCFVGREVFVYRNLHKNCWSLRDVKTRRVIAHASSLWLCNAKFKVSEAGRQRVLSEKRKNVHAGVVGIVMHEPDRVCGFRRVSYNPYKGPYFFQIFSSCSRAVFQKDYAGFDEDGRVFCCDL